MTGSHLLLYIGLVGLSFVVSLPLVANIMQADGSDDEHYAFGYWLVWLAMSFTTAGLWMFVFRWLSRIEPNR